LFDRQQRVKLSDCDIVSEWVPLNSGLPQGSWLGPLVFILVTDGLKSNELLHKYADNLAVSEIFNRYKESKMNAVLSTINQWSERNLLNINCSKTKDMLFES
jgi:hypothetical protein